MTSRGAYTADRAAALSGVPLSTVRWWARHEILVPSISQTRTALWSYGDLMGLRVIHWLRHPKLDEDEREIPASTMRLVRLALADLAELDMALWTEDSGPAVRVDQTGHVFLATQPSLERVGDHQRALGDDADNSLNVLAPFETHNAKGPDLVRPRPHLRIVPGKLGGSPHIENTRLESQAVGALAASGLPMAKIYRLYPEVEQPAINDALALEHQLAGNLGRELRAA
jgi:uncharacterized protein (DUF433 family)